MGKKKLKFVFDNGGMNLNYFTITDYNVSVQEMGAENSTVIYPNPSSCEVTISLAEPLKDESELSIVNSAGLAVRTLSANDLNDRKNIVIDLSGLSKGIYFLKVGRTGKEIQKIVVQ
jgi:hypothetical protein